MIVEHIIVEVARVVPNLVGAIAAIVPQFFAVLLPVFAVLIAPVLAIVPRVIEIVPPLILILLEIIPRLLPIVGALVPGVVAIVDALLPLVIPILGTFAPIGPILRPRRALIGARPIARTGSIPRKLRWAIGECAPRADATGDTEEIPQITPAWALARAGTIPSTCAGTGSIPRAAGKLGWSVTRTGPRSVRAARPISGTGTRTIARWQL
jgi:hypothetical protein